MAETPNTDKYTQAIAACTVTENDAEVADAVKKIIDEHYAENDSKEVYAFLLNLSLIHI